MRETLLTLYVLVAVVGAARFLTHGLPKQIAPAIQEFEGDCVVDWIGARAWAERYDPYSDEGLKRFNLNNLGHPPTTPFWFIPLRSYDPRQSHGIVGVIVLFLLFTELWLIATELGAPAVPATVALAFGFVVHQTWMSSHISAMQISEPLAFLFVLSWWFLRRGRELAGGAAMGLALTLKFIPGLILIWFALTRRWKALGAAVAAWLPIAAIMTWGFGGLACWREFFAKQPEVNDYWAASPKNGALAGVVLRLFWHACHDRHGNLPLATTITVVVSLILLYLAWRLGRRAGGVDLPFALFSTVAVFVNPVIWEHYYVLLIFPFAVAARTLYDSPLPRWKQAAGVTALAFVLWMVTFDIEAKFQVGHPRHWHLKMHLYEIANWIVWPILITLLGALAYQRGSIGRSRVSPVAPQ
jgi:hypothetical protein